MVVCFSTITVQIAHSINHTLLLHKLIIDNILTKSFFKRCFCEICKLFSMSFYRLQWIVFLLNITTNYSGTVNIELHTPLRCIVYNFHCSYKVSRATKITWRRQRGRMGKWRRFYNDPNWIIWVQPPPWSRSCVLEWDALRWLSLLGGFEQAANLVDKNSKKSTGTLDHRKLLSGCGFLQSRSSPGNEKCADRLIS